MRGTVILSFIFGWSLATADTPSTNFVRPYRGSSLDDIFFSSNAVSADRLTIRLHATCFSTNGKTVANPVSPMGAIRISMGIGPTSDPVTKVGPGDFSVIIPGWVPMNREAGGPNQRNEVFRVQNPAQKGSVVHVAQNLVVVYPPSTITPGVVFDPNAGFAPISSTMTALRYINFKQDLLGRGKCWGNRPPLTSNQSTLDQFQGFARLLLSIPLSWAGGGGAGGHSNEIASPTNPDDSGFEQPSACSNLPGWDPAAAAAGLNPVSPDTYAQYYSKFLGTDGFLTGQWRMGWSSDYTLLQVHAAFPGHAEMCGSYYSPLMLFFGRSRPQLGRVAEFEITAGRKSIQWPEYSADYGFLGVDWNGNGRIDHGAELFGTATGHENGFEALKIHDANEDGLINSKDPIFRRLVLWRDSSEKGISRKRDLIPLGRMGVKAIDLQYSNEFYEGVFDRGEFRQRSRFIFESGNKTKTGEVIDVWLAGS